MAFTLQNDIGDIADANAYIDAAYFKAYHDDRGNDYTAFDDDDLIQKAIVRATDYLDRRFTFIGRPLQNPQSTQWPRANAWDSGGRHINGIHEAVKRATAEYALRALSASLAPDPTRDDSGARIQSKTTTVDAVSESITYVGGAGYELPQYPLADGLLVAAGLVIIARRLVRA